MKAPEFSVVIPTYNRARVLIHAVESVLKQTFQNFEIIIIDDASNDDTQTVIRNYKDARIRSFINNRTKGQAGARNVGIYNARAEWIVFLDSDDIWKPELLESIYRVVEKCNDNVGLIHTGFMWTDKQCNIKKLVYKKKRRGNLYKDLVYKNHIGTFSCVAVRTSIVKQIDGFDENFSALVDWEYYLRVSQVAEIEVIPEILVYYRYDFGGNLTADNVKLLSNLLQFNKKFQKEISSHPTAKYRLAYRICYYSFKTNRWKLYFKYLPLTINAIGKDEHNIFSLHIKLAYTMIRYMLK